jgi:heme A synthase
MASAGLRLRTIRATALLLTVLSLMVVLLSAYLRLDGAGLGCADWPACYGRLLASEPGELHFGVVRLLHRAVASMSLLLACALVWQCWRRPSIEPAAGPATLLLLLMLALSALGIWSSDPRLTLVGFLNIMGGLGLVTFSWRVVLASESWVDAAKAGRADPGAAPGSGRAVGYCGPGCPDWRQLLGARLRFVSRLRRQLVARRGRLGGAAALLCPDTATPAAGDPGGATLHLLHRYSAVATLLVLGAAGVQALADEERRGRPGCCWSCW